MTDRSKLFNSQTDPIPQVRPDITIIPVHNNGSSGLYFHDRRGYVTPDFALDRAAGPLLSLLDGQKSIMDLKAYLGQGTSTHKLLQYIRFLDENRLLYSPHFRAFSERMERVYEQSKIHHPLTAGNSYPSNPEALHSFLDEAFTKFGDPQPANNNINVKALYAPHIDPRVNMETYVQAFQTLKNLKPRRVVILATSHYSGLYPKVYKNKPFIISNKDFAMPLGAVRADRGAIRQLRNNAGTALATNDRAHRVEHSIEMHLLFLSYLWTHDFSLVPILVGSFEELYYSGNNYLSRQISKFSRALVELFGNDDETLFLISGDLAHTGKKFGDEKPAASMKPEVKRFDKAFLASAEKGSPEQMLRLMKQNYDPYRICGFPPLFTFLKAFPTARGKTLCYHRWDETERESAVTFGSILYT